MDLEPDHHRLAQLQTEDQERSGIWWATVIAIGVLFGNALSFGAYELYQRWQLQQFMVSLDAMLGRQHERSLEHQKELAARNRERQRAAEHERSVRSQLHQTCMFWREQVRVDDSPKNRQYRDMACAKVR